MGRFYGEKAPIPIKCVREILYLILTGNSLSLVLEVSVATSSEASVVLRGYGHLPFSGFGGFGLLGSLGDLDKLLSVACRVQVWFPTGFWTL